MAKDILHELQNVYSLKSRKSKIILIILCFFTGIFSGLVVSSYTLLLNKISFFRNGYLTNLTVTKIIIGLIVNMLLVSAAYAADVSWQVRNAAILSNNSVSGDGLRYVGWGLTKLFTSLGSIAESIYNKTFGMIDITRYPAIEALIKRFYPVLVALMVLCII